MIQNYRNEMLEQISDALHPGNEAMRELLTNEIPAELKTMLNDANSPARARMMGFAFGGILEQFEDDFDSDDSELLSYIAQWQQYDRI